MSDRAAQFAPFAALAGYDDAVRETARLTEKKIELGEDERQRLDCKMQSLLEHLADAPQVAITYFVPDARKDGGAYVSVCGQLKKFDNFSRVLYFVDGTKIPMDDIIAMDYSTWPDPI